MRFDALFYGWLNLLALGVLLASCQAPPSQHTAELKYGVHENAMSANVLNLRPNQSLAICAPSEEWVTASHDAIEQWATAIGRWGHIKINPCGSTSDLVIQLRPSEQAPYPYTNVQGLNYFNSSPGYIYMLSTSSKDMIKATALHEFGHSFGLCDQYRATASEASCAIGSPQPSNNEVMGATSPNKLKLTPGDIAGVKKAAEFNLAVAAEWSTYLATNPTPQGSDPKSPGSGLFARILEGTSAQYVSLQISVPQEATAVLCQSQESDETTCSDQSTGKIELVRVTGQDISGRTIYETAKPIALATGRKNYFRARASKDQQTVVSQKFVITK